MTSVVIDNVVLLPKTSARISANLLVLQTYPQAKQNFASPRAVVVENVNVVQAWRGNLNVLGSGPNALTADIFIGQDTYGWPLEAFEPPTFPQSWKYSAVILNAAPPYAYATDVRRKGHSIQFYEEDTFFKQWKGSQVTVNTYTPYAYATDVQRAKQALVFTDPEIFFTSQFYNPITLAGVSSLTMPNVVGLPVSGAQALLAALGFVSVTALNSLTATGPKGIVSSQLPVAGTGVSIFTPVTIFAPGLMPNVVGLLLQQAEAVLKATGILVPASIGYFGTGTLRTQQGNVPFAAATWPIQVIWVNQQSMSFNVDGLVAPAPIPDQVIAQSPASGVFIAPNSTVTLTVIAPATATAYPGTNLTSF